MATGFGVLGTASVDIDVRLDKLQTEFRKGQRQVERSTNRMSRRVEGFERRVTSATAATVKWGVALVGVTGVAALGRFVSGVARAGDELAKTSRSLDLSVESLQEFRFAAERTGIATNQFDEGLRRFARRLGLFRQNEGGAAAEAFKDLGLAADISSGKISDTEDALLKSITALSQIKEANLQAALASQLFGDRVGTQFSLLARIGPEAIDALRQEIRDIGVVSTETANQSEEFVDALTNLSNASNELANVIGPAVLPVLTDFINFITQDAIPAIGDFAEAIDTRAADAVRAFRELLLPGEITLPIPPKPVIEDATEGIKALTVEITEFTAAVKEVGPENLNKIIEDLSRSRQTRDDALAANTLDALKEEVALIEERNRALGEAAPIPPSTTAGEARAAERADALQPALDRAADAARGFSSAFGSAFEDAIFQAGTLTDTVTALGEELARVALRVAVIEPLARSLGGAASSSLFGPTATAASGRIISGLGTNGAMINRPTIIPMAAGGVLAGEAGREAILPLDRMSSGRLGVDASGMGGQEVQIIDQRGASAPDIQRRTTNGPGGAQVLQLLIRSEVESMFSDGSADPLMGTFGSKRTGISRG